MPAQVFIDLLYKLLYSESPGWDELRMNESDLTYCGMSCSKCPIFAATKADDDELRKKIAREWSSQYAEILQTFGVDRLNPEDINCNGCRSDEGHFKGCRKCAIKPCCQERKLATCAGCREYESCDSLKGFFSFEVHKPAKKNLDRIRRRSI